MLEYFKMPWCRVVMTNPLKKCTAMSVTFPCGCQHFLSFAFTAQRRELKHIEFYCKSTNLIGSVSHRWLFADRPRSRVRCPWKGKLAVLDFSASIEGLQTAVLFNDYNKTTHFRFLKATVKHSFNSIDCWLFLFLHRKFVPVVQLLNIT